jgi:hypothetical protein
MIIAIIVLSLLLIVSVYLNWILSKKVTLLEGYASDFLTDLVHLKEKIRDANKVIKEADIRGSFESDDEVGSVFKILKDSIEYLDTTSNIPFKDE